MKGLTNILLSILFIILINGGCKKSDVVVDEFKLTDVKLYDDTFAGGENTNVKISAGRDRLYMTYGYGTGVTTTINGINFFDPSNLQQTLMSTDLNGEFIWRSYITPGYNTSTPRRIKVEIFRKFLNR